MESVSELIQHRGTQLEALLRTFLLEHSSIYLFNTPGSNMFIVSGDYAYGELETEGRRLQSELLEKYREFDDLLDVLLREQPDSLRKENQKRRERVLGTIEQGSLTWNKSIEEVWNSGRSALQAQVDSIQSLYGAADDGAFVIVPDTNALLWHPDLEAWSFDDVPEFELCLVPVVLSELDGLKVNHRNEAVREKAEGLIRRIKGYRDRGSLRDGVPLKKGVSRIRSIAVEPDFSASLSWLDSSHGDDRLVATFIEVMRTNPRSAVVLVTRDLNLQNKMEFARLPFLEPPGPA